MEYYWRRIKLKKIIIILILLGFILGMIFSAIITIHSIKIVKIESNGKIINNAGITISIFGSSFDYYYE